MAAAREVLVKSPLPVLSRVAAVTFATGASASTASQRESKRGSRDRAAERFDGKGVKVRKAYPQPPGRYGVPGSRV